MSLHEKDGRNHAGTLRRHRKLRARKLCVADTRTAALGTENQAGKKERATHRGPHLATSLRAWCPFADASTLPDIPAVLGSLCEVTATDAKRILSSRLIGPTRAQKLRIVPRRSTQQSTGRRKSVHRLLRPEIVQNCVALDPHRVESIRLILR